MVSVDDLNETETTKEKANKRKSFSLFKRKTKEPNEEDGRKVSSIKDIKLEDKIIYTDKNNKREFGTVKYIGDLKGDKKKQKWIGIEWVTEGFGDCDGEIYSNRYFTTKPKTATFIDFKSFITSCLILE